MIGFKPQRNLLPHLLCNPISNPIHPNFDTNGDLFDTLGE